MRKIYSIFILSLLVILLQAQDLTIDGSVVVQADGELYVNGSVLIKPGGTLDIQSSGSNVGFVEVNHDGVSGIQTWECNGSTISTGGDGEVYFKGDLDYNIEGTSVSFPHLIVDVTTLVGIFNVAEINVIDSIHVAKTLDLKNGRMITAANKVVYVSNSSPDAIKSSDGAFGANYSNFIEGSLRREVAIGATNYYKFPIGCAPNAGLNKRGYNPAFLDFRTGGGTIEARKPATVTSIVGRFEELADPGIIGYHNMARTCYSSAFQFLELHWMVKEFGYWDFVPNDDETAGWWYSFYVKPDIDYIFDHNFNLTHMKIMKAPPSFTPAPASDWTPYVYESGNGCDMVSVYNDEIYWKPGPNTSTFPYDLTDSIRASELRSFSRFGLGGGIGAGLPIELLYLEAHPVDNSYIQVNWATATEINNSGFEVQRSTDGINFTTIEWVPGAGNSSTRLPYGIPDRNVVPSQLYYYRLNQIDYDGSSELTYVVSAMITATSTFTISEFIPNPTENDSRIEVLTSDEKNINVTVYNTLGQIISKADQHLVPGTNRIDFDFNLLADGTYYAIFLADNQVYSRKLILTK
ncbi:MAG: T9SS type A sorting domain-containing protein [Chitinophagales bacterium]|nr:T9SS type A sorting domain-containing protein [Chitinophagales bacterium]